MRADAQRNRDQIIAAARALFIEQGLDVPMEEIARRAGVGVGTVYRRFPDRDALTMAVAIAAVLDMVANARAALDEEPDAWHALRRTILGFTGVHIGVVHLVVGSRMPEVIAAEPELREARQAWLDLAELMVTGAQDLGVLRRDVSFMDVAVMTSLLTRPLPGTRIRGEPTIPERFLDIMLDGLRTRPGLTALPGEALSFESLTAKVCS